MPFSSAQISGLVGGQQVMFSNQISFANQMGSLGEAGPAPAMSNPYPAPSYGLAGMDPAASDMGTRMAGGMAMSLPGIAAGGTMAASLLGYRNPLGLLDPFTGISRAFGAGTGGTMGMRAGVMAGAEGMGLRYAAGNIGGAFASGGLRAGLGALGGGLLGAAAAAVPYYLAGKAIGHIGETAYEGVQNFQDVRRMSAQYFEPQYGQPGAGLGGKPAAGMVKNITSFMHELASEDVMTGMKEMRSLMDRAGSMGMLQGIGDANQFKERFRNIVRQTRSMAQILGTTLEEALPLVNQLQQMGMWTAKDVLGTAAAVKAAGPGGAQAMVGAMQQGAQMSYQMGGKLGAGAQLGQELFGQVSAATRAGVFSQQDIRNFTGGVGGAEGQRMVAGGLQQVMSGFGQTAMGRLMMAGLGEVKGNEFTGRMDEKLLSKFQRGEISAEELQSRGQGRIRGNKSLAVSFFNRADELGQSMAQQGGVSGMAQGIQQAMVKAGYAGASDAIQNRFIQLITGSNQRQADMLQKLIKDLPRIQAEQDRANSAALDDSFRQLDERRNKSLAGLGDAVKQAYREGIGRPLQELGEGITAQMSEATSRTVDRIMGRTKALPRLNMNQRLMLASAGTPAASSWEAMGVKGVGEGFVQGDLLSGVIGRVREEGFGGRFMGGVAAGTAAGTPMMVPGMIAGGVVGGASALLGVGPFGKGGGLSPQARALMEAGMETRRGEVGAGDVSVGGGLVANLEQAERVARRTYTRASDATLGGLFGGETDEKRSALNRVSARMRAIYNSPKTASELEKVKKDPVAHRKMLARLLKQDPEAAEAMKVLEGASPGGAGSAEAELDVIAAGQKDLGYENAKHAMDFGKMAQNIQLPSTPREIEDFRQRNIESMTEAAGGFGLGGFLKSIGKGAVGGGIAGLATGGIMAAPGMLLGAVGGGLKYLSSRGMSEADIQAAMSSDQFSAKDIEEYAKIAKGEAPENPNNAFAAAVSRGDTAAAKIADFLRSASPEDQKKFLQSMGNVSAVQRKQYEDERRNRMKDLAGRQEPIDKIAGVRSSVSKGLEAARQSFAKGDMASGEAAISALAGSQKMGKREVDLLLYGRGGEVGRQLGRLAAIGGMGEMDEAALSSFQERLKGNSGIDLFQSPEIAARVSEMLKSGRKISGGEVTELKELLTKAAPGALGQGAGTQRSAAEEAQMKFIAANERFVLAVGKVLGDDLGKAAQDVKEANPVVQ